MHGAETSMSAEITEEEASVGKKDALIKEQKEAAAKEAQAPPATGNMRSQISRKRSKQCLSLLKAL